VRTSAESVLHWYRPDRAGQVRGVPDILPALPLFAQLRRYTRAVIAAAETAAMIAGVMSTDQPAEVSEVAAMDRVEFERNALLTLPAGWEAMQFKAEQPTQTYEGFKIQILNEIGRCVNAPSNLTSGDSSRHNYSSARLDFQIYNRSIRVERSAFEQRIIDRIFLAWLDEAFLIPGYLPNGLPPIAQWSWGWFWDGFDSIDPTKDASADQTRLSSRTTTLAEVFAAAGQDWEEQLEQMARENEAALRLGLSPLYPASAASDREIGAEEEVEGAA
jgi:capsid protein